MCKSLPKWIKASLRATARDASFCHEVAQGTVRRSPEKEPRGGRSVRLVHAHEVSGRVVGEQRFDVELHQLPTTRHTIDHAFGGDPPARSAWTLAL